MLTGDSAQPYVDAYIDEVLQAARAAYPPSGAKGWSDLRAAIADDDRATRIFVDVERARERSSQRHAPSQPLADACLRVFRRAVFEAIGEALPRAIDGNLAATPRRAGALSAASRAFLASMRAVARRSAERAPPTLAQLREVLRREVRVRFHEPAGCHDDMGDDISALVVGAWDRLELCWLRIRADDDDGDDGDDDADADDGAALPRVAELRATLPDDAALMAFWHKLLACASPPASALGLERVNRDDLLGAARATLGGACADETLGLPSLFLKLRVDAHGRVAARSVHAYAVRLIELLRTRLLLRAYESPSPSDADELGGSPRAGRSPAPHAGGGGGGGGGWLRESDVENLVLDQLREMPSLRAAPHLAQSHSFVPFYLAHAAVYLLADASARSGVATAVPVRALLLSRALSEFLQLRVDGAGADEPDDDDDADADADDADDDDDDDDDEAAAEAAHERRMAASSKRAAALRSAAAGHPQRSWFRIDVAIRTYRTFLRLDLDHDGMLGPDELKRYGDGGATGAFLRRVFEVCPTYDGRLDYKGYLVYALAHERTCSEAALAFFWRVLDLRGAGRLGGGELRLFLRAVMAAVERNGDEAVAVELVAQDLLELARVLDGTIAFSDLLRSGAGETIVTVLSDAHAFWRWDNRERLLQYEPDAPVRPAPADRRRLFAHADASRGASPRAHGHPPAAARSERAELAALRARSATLALVEVGVDAFAADAARRGAEASGPILPDALTPPASDSEEPPSPAPSARAAAHALAPRAELSPQSPPRTPPPPPPRTPPPASSAVARVRFDSLHAPREYEGTELVASGPSGTPIAPTAPPLVAAGAARSAGMALAGGRAGELEIVALGGELIQIDDLLRWVAAIAFTERGGTARADPRADVRGRDGGHRAQILGEIDALRRATVR